MNEAPDGSTSARTIRGARSSLRPPLPWSRLAVAVSATAAATLPFFLVGTLALRISADIGFDEAQLGLAATARSLLTCVVAAMAGRAAQRFGPSQMIRIGAVTSAAAALGIGGVSVGPAALIAFAGLTGVASAILMPASDLWISQTVPPARQGVAYGIKQGGQPMSALLAGLAVPAIGATLGWRWAFGLAGGGALLLAAVIPSVPHARRASGTSMRAGDVSLTSMLMLAAGQAFAAATVGIVAAFFVVSAVRAGISESSAGLLFAAGSVLGILARVVVGSWADRRAGSFLFGVAMMLGIGTAGYLLLASLHPIAVAVATPLVFAGGWGWPGLFSLAVVRANPNAPGAAIGITQTGASIGAVVGPAVFGLVATTSFVAAWLLTAACALIAATIVLVGRNQLRRELRASRTRVSSSRE